MRVMIDSNETDMKSLWYDCENNKVCYIDQRMLPFQFQIYRVGSLEENLHAIRDMVVRGAPAIGIASAWALYQAVVSGRGVEETAQMIKGTRPTARDLFHAVDTLIGAYKEEKDPYQCCLKLENEIVGRCKKIGIVGEPLIEDGANLLTHCNAGALATVDWGTALAPMRMAHRKGKRFHVYVDETRPRLQGSRLTAWELGMEGIRHTVIADNAAGHLLYRGEIDLVITGADRITAKGFVANKIGTYEKAVLAKENGVPFYVAAPVSTFDFSIREGNEIPIEMRDPSEVTHLEGKRMAAEGSPAINPAFDVTPPAYVTGFITETGILEVGEIERMKKERIVI